MKARVKWLEGMTLVGEAGSGHAVVMDAAPEVGGRDLGAAYGDAAARHGRLHRD